MNLTEQQTDVIDTAAAGGHLVVNALAGTGKTSVLAEITARMHRPALYVAFNREPVDDAARRMSKSTRCATFHELATQAVGDPWVSRARAPRMKPRALADMLGIDDLHLSGIWGNKTIPRETQAGMVVNGLRSFCKTADPEPGIWHIAIPRAARDDPELLLLWRSVRECIAPLLAPAWAGVLDPGGTTPVDGNTLIKLWQLTDPVLPYDQILVDEAQDLNGAMRSVIEAQMGYSQIIATGDTYQQINAWNGSTNALENLPIDQRRWLTISWRFGPEIADKANLVLVQLDADRWVIGRGDAGTVGTLQFPHVTLCRTNAVAAEFYMDALARGLSAHIIKGAADVERFAKSAAHLQAGRKAYHEDLACFDTWGEVLAYVARDELGLDIGTLVDLCQRWGADRVAKAVANQPPADQADVVFSTTHKIKGRQWPTVRLAGDFKTDSDENTRLLYVAVTRAQRALDVDVVPFFARPQRQEQQT